MASELEPNNSLSTANTVVAGQAISGQANGESDFYKLVVPASSSGLSTPQLPLVQAHLAGA